MVRVRKDRPSRGSPEIKKSACPRANRRMEMPILHVPPGSRPVEHPFTCWICGVVEESVYDLMKHITGVHSQKSCTARRLATSAFGRFWEQRKISPNQSSTSAVEVNLPVASPSKIKIEDLMPFANFLASPAKEQ